MGGKKWSKIKNKKHYLLFQIIPCQIYVFSALPIFQLKKIIHTLQANQNRVFIPAMVIYISYIAVLMAPEPGL